MWESVLLTAALMLAMAGLFIWLLALANVKLAVEIDPRQEALSDVLPGANCGGCGYASCESYAKSIVKSGAEVNLCSVGGPPVAEQLAGVMGIEFDETFPFRPVIHCRARGSDRLQRGRYTGEKTCVAANVVGGVQGCTYGCLGFGDCVTACEYDAMEMIGGLPEINYENCIGCGACVRACPRGIIEQIPFKVEQMLVVACANHDPPKRVRQVCQVGCIGCSACQRIEQELFQISGGLAAIDYDQYTGDEDFDRVLEKCPAESLVLLGKPTPDYLEELAEVEAVTRADRSPLPVRPTAEDLDWHG